MSCARPSAIFLQQLIAAALSIPLWVSAAEVQLATLEWPPYSGSIPDQGFLSIIVREALRPSGDTVTVHVLPWRRAVNSAMRGQDGIQGFFSASPAECTQAQGVLSMPIGYYQFGLAQRVDSPVVWNTPNDLFGKVLGVVDGYDNGPLVSKLMESQAIRLETASSDSVNLRKLRAKRMDMASVDVQVFSFLKKQERLTDLELNKKVTTPRLPLHVCFNTDTESRKTMERLNRGLRGVRMDAIAKRYISEN